MYACEENQLDIVRYFVEVLKMNIEQTDINGQTAFIYAC